MLSSDSLYVWSLLTCFQCIFELWNGVLLSKNAALQLLLIIDHIFDWAWDFVTHLFPIVRPFSSCVGCGGGAEIFSPSET